ncbi:MAG: hypothetical protein NT106_07130, partial [Candidatus Sumerlaeota bacterium]|nr:hypothetical protein [Candidatus Sumerlaeota bacterium]
LCCMVRPTLFFFPAFVFVLYMLRRILQRDKKGFGAFALPLMKNYILLYLFALLIFSPWVIRNLVVFKKFILFSTESGMCFYSGTRYDYNKGNYHDFGEHTSEIAQMDEFAKNEFLLKVGLKTFLSEFKKDPAGYAGWYLRKIASLWEPYIIYYPDPIFKNNIIVKNQHRLLIMAGMTAVIFAICFPMPAMGLLIILFIYHTLLHVSLIAISRYTFPIMPLVMIAGSYGLSLLFDALKNILTGGIGQKVFTRVRLVVGLVLLLYVLMCLRDNFKQSSALFNLDVHPFFLSKAFGAIMRACIILYLGAILALVIKAKLVTRENKVVFFALLVFFFYISMLSGYQRLRILGIAQSFQVRLPTSATLRRQSYGPAFAAASAELAASATIEHVIDLPRWSKGYPDVRLLLSIFNSNNKPIDYDLEIFVNDALMRRFGRGDILSDSALSEIQISLPLKMADAGKALHVKIIYRSNAGGNYPILCGTAHVFRGVSLFNGQDKNLAPSPQAETGTYSIGLRLYGKSRWTNVYYWRGSRRKAAMVADAACSAL